MTYLANTLLWLVSVVGNPAVIHTPDGYCEGVVTRMGVARFPDCPGAPHATRVWVYEAPDVEPEESEAVGFAEREDWRLTDVDGWGDTWLLHFGSDEPEGWGGEGGR